MKRWDKTSTSGWRSRFQAVVFAPKVKGGRPTTTQTFNDYCQLYEAKVNGCKGVLCLARDGNHYRKSLRSIAAKLGHKLVFVRDEQGVVEVHIRDENT